MASAAKPVNPYEKDKMREEIAEQVREFLSKGGEIDVIGNHDARPARIIGDTWHAQFDPQSLAV